VVNERFEIVTASQWASSSNFDDIAGITLMPKNIFMCPCTMHKWNLIFLTKFLLLKFSKDAYKDSKGKNNLEKGNDNKISLTFVHSIGKIVMQGKFADLQKSILVDCK